MSRYARCRKPSTGSSAFNKAVKVILMVLFLWVVIASCITVPVSAATTVDSQVIKGPVIGIDLGTTYSCVAHHSNGETIVIPNEMGNRITPSIVSFKDNERLIGDAAKNVMTSNPLNTVFGVKRLIGRMYDDKQVKKDMKLWPFKIVEDVKTHKPMVEIEYKGEVKRYYAEEISAMVLAKMKQIAEDYLGESVTNAVITVPAYFNDQQRQATKDAGVIAGLNVLRLINEPTAAAMAYGIGNAGKRSSGKDTMNIIVYDLGGGTFDVTLMELDSNGVFEVLSTSGDTHLGGEDFDNRIIDYYIKIINKKYNVNIRDNERALSKLKREVEKAKRTLSSAKQVRIEIDNIVTGVDFEDTLSRAKFESINNDLFRKTMKPLKQVLTESELSKSDVDEIVLVGGSTRIPKIQEMVSQFFNGKQVNRGINEDEAVAYGAAIQAAIIKGDDGSSELPIVMDVTPLSLGIETVGGIMTNIIDKNSIIPNSKSQIFSTYQDNQPAVTIKVYQGERAKTKDNILLGEFNLNDIPPAPKGQPQIEVSFNVDVNGILQVSARDKQSNNEESISIDKHTSGLSQEDIEKALKEAAEFEEHDEIIRKIVATKNEMESKAYAIKNRIENDEMTLNDEYERDTVMEACDEVLEWLERHSSYEDEDFLDYLKEKQAEFNDLIDPIISQGYNNHNNNDEDEDYYDREL